MDNVKWIMSVKKFALDEIKFHPTFSRTKIETQNYGIRSEESP